MTEDMIKFPIEYDQLKVSILLKKEVVAEIDEIINNNPELYHNRSHFVRRGIFLALKQHRKGSDK